MLDVLDFLHSSKRYHRDVKPTNINIDSKGRVRLLDYGITKSLREPHITEEDARFVGTYRYSAPEYIIDNDYGFTSDLYSFGAVLYFLLHDKEIFHAVKRQPDIIRAKERHQLSFDDGLEANGPMWKSLLDLCRQLLQREPSKRPASAMACMDSLAKAVPPLIPYRLYFACSLTRITEIQKKRIDGIQAILRNCGEKNGFSLYLPGEHTHPLGAPDLSPAEVYWIDRERVASSDLLLVLADEPSFGVGQEAEIAANAGVPIAIFHSTGINVSRMLRGIPGRIIEQVAFDDERDLEIKAHQFFSKNKGRLRVSRTTRDIEYHLRVGNRVRDARKALDLGVTDLSEKAEVSKELIESMETRPEKLSNTSLINLRRVSRALGVSPAELLKEQSGKEQELEDLSRASIVSLRKFAVAQDLTYKNYARLKAQGLQALRQQIESTAARGTPGPLNEDQWRTIFHQLVDSRLEEKIANPVSKD
jgi:serine/threonine protein kinase